MVTLLNTNTVLPILDLKYLLVLIILCVVIMINEHRLQKCDYESSDNFILPLVALVYGEPKLILLKITNIVLRNLTSF